VRHCTFCQRRTGGALSIHVWFDEKDVTLSGNEPATYEQRSDESNYYLSALAARSLAANTKAERRI
jgi:hypothetical protein